MFGCSTASIALHALLATTWPMLACVERNGGVGVIVSSHPRQGVVTCLHYLGRSVSGVLFLSSTMKNKYMEREEAGREWHLRADLVRKRRFEAAADRWVWEKRAREMPTARFSRQRGVPIVLSGCFPQARFPPRMANNAVSSIYQP